MPNACDNHNIHTHTHTQKNFIIKVNRDRVTRNEEKSSLKNESHFYYIDAIGILFSQFTLKSLKLLLNTVTLEKVT